MGAGRGGGARGERWWPVGCAARVPAVLRVPAARHPAAPLRGRRWDPLCFLCVFLTTWTRARPLPPHTPAVFF